MDNIFDKIGKKASETYKVTAEKTGKIAKSAKLKLKIGELKSNKEELENSIGKKVYEEYAKKAKSIELKDIEECKKIEDIEKEIKDLEKECLELDDKKKCKKCGVLLGKDIKFCPECGTKQPEPKKEEVKEVEVIEKKEECEGTEKTTIEINKKDEEPKKEATKKEKDDLEKTVKVESAVKDKKKSE